MMKRNADNMRHLVRKGGGLFEIIVLTIVYYVFWRVSYDADIFPNFFGRGKYVLMGVYAALIVVVFCFNEGLRFGYLKIIDVVLSQWIGIGLVNFLTYFQLLLIANKLVSPVPMLVLTVIDFLIALSFSYLITTLYSYASSTKQMILIYGNGKSVNLYEKMNSRSDKYRITRLLSVEEGMEAVKEQVKKYDAVVLCDISGKQRNDILKFCYMNGIRIYATPKISDVIVRGAEDIHLFDTPLLLTKESGMSFEQRFLKRAMDILLCGVALLILWPFMLITAVAIKCEDRGPVFYKQRRVTVGGKEFDILKFRSMIVNAEKDGKSVPATDSDPRITRVGRIIRAIRFDELPQIINVLKGEMSIVGPRPERTEHVEEYTKDIPEFVLRTKVKGGLTGYAQVYGKYNTSAYDKLKMDLMYIENYSLLLDIKIILTTIRILFKKESTEGFDKRDEGTWMSEAALASEDVQNQNSKRSDKMKKINAKKFLKQVAICLLLIGITDMVGLGLYSMIKNRFQVYGDTFKYMYQIESLEIDDKILRLNGFAFALEEDSSKVKPEFIFVKYTDELIGKKGSDVEDYRMKTSYYTRDDVNEHFLCEYDYSESGFVAEIDYKKNKMDIQNEVYRLLIKDKRSSKTVATSTYLVNGEIMNCDPKEYEPIDLSRVGNTETEQELRNVITDGILQHYEPTADAYIYQYNGFMYWICGEDFYFEEDGSTRIQWLMNTTQPKLLPEERVENNYLSDNRNFTFEQKEIILEGESGYRMAKCEIPTEYSIYQTWTGYFVNGEYIWRADFRPYVEFE